MPINKKILTSFALVVIGAVIVYEMIFNLILPIALLFFDLYLLKILLKGFDNDEKIKSLLLFGDSSNLSSTKNNIP